MKKDKLWFNGSNEIECSLELVKKSIQDIGMHYTNVVGGMPGITNSELIEEGEGFVNIKTNEGIMKRTNISKTISTDRVVIECDEEYQAGKMVNSKSHIMSEFVKSENGIKHHLVISKVEASGLLGFFYRYFGNKNIGSAFLGSYKRYLEL